MRWMIANVVRHFASASEYAAAAGKALTCPAAVRRSTGKLACPSARNKGGNWHESPVDAGAAGRGGGTGPRAGADPRPEAGRREGRRLPPANAAGGRLLERPAA